MTTGLKIKEVADASGFTAATLRYYEQIGLLPEASRTAKARGVDEPALVHGERDRVCAGDDRKHAGHFAHAEELENLGQA